MLPVSVAVSLISSMADFLSVPFVRKNTVNGMSYYWVIMLMLPFSVAVSSISSVMVSSSTPFVRKNTIYIWCVI
jgi:hypothetical protein